jgi:hypothetical protein
MLTLRHLIVPGAFALILAVVAAPIPGDSQAVVPEQFQSVPLQVAVTGGPAPVPTLQLALLTALRAEFPEARDARLTLLSTTRPLVDLPLSSAFPVQASVAISAPGQPPVTRVIPTVFTNVVMPWSDAQALLVSNSPETLSFGKVLFTRNIKTSQTVRLLYHHQNGSKTQHMLVSVNLSNPTPSPITLWLSGAQCAGIGDELGLGHQAARQFLEAYRSHAGFVLRIPPHTTLPFLLHDLAPDAVGSGLAQLQVIDGDQLTLQVTARLNGEMDPPADSYAPNSDMTHQRGMFPRPQITRLLTYTVEGPPAAMVLGADSDLIREDETGVLLQGNYGVIYLFDVQVSNPTTKPATAALVLHADGGVARGTILVGTKVIEAPAVQPNQPKILATIKLGPGTSRLIRIATMPESGSNYPVRITLGPP